VKLQEIVITLEISLKICNLTKIAGFVHLNSNPDN
jgi:hypothetical protein